MTDTHTLGTGFDSALTLEKLEKTLAELKAIPENKDFVLVTPDGVLYKGNYDEIIHVMLTKHQYSSWYTPFNPMKVIAV